MKTKIYETQVTANFTFMTLKDVVQSRAQLIQPQHCIDQILINSSKTGPLKCQISARITVDMLQVKSNLRSICSALGQFVPA